MLLIFHNFINKRCRYILQGGGKYMKKIHMIEILFLSVLFGYPVFSNKPKYTVKSSEERIDVLVSFIEKNLEGTSVLTNFNEEQRLWEAYKKAHLETLTASLLRKPLWAMKFIRARTCRTFRTD